MHRLFTTRRWLRGAGFAALAAATPLTGCSDLLEVTDPDIILEANSPAAAIALRNGAFLRLSQALTGTQGPDALFVFAGLLTDEWRSGDTFVQRNNQDQRIFWPENTFNPGPYRALNRVRVEGERAIAGFRTYLPDSTAAIGMMFALTAYVETLIGEHYCNGTPLSGLDGTTIVFGAPITNDSIFRLTVANADSAIAQAALAPARDATRAAEVRNLASVVKGRALVNLGQFSAAATAVAAVPTTFRFNVFHSANTTTNQIWSLNNSARRYTLVDREGGVGLDYVSANDPRVIRRSTSTSIFDTSVPLTVTQQGMYGQYDPVPLATGVEARLIEAEAQLQAGGDPAVWLSAVNALRINTALYPSVGSGLPTTGTGAFTRGPNLTGLADPGSAAARVDAHFRERAFWMYSTGHRLGDMRRLLRQYGRTESQVYPNGAYFKGGSFGSALMMPVPFAETNNPQFTQCIDEKA